MQQNIDLTTITDVQQLKALKSDSYDQIAVAQEQIQRSQANLQQLNARIGQLQEKPTDAPVEAEVVG